MISNRLPWLGPDGQTVAPVWYIFLSNINALLGGVASGGVAPTTADDAVALQSITAAANLGELGVTAGKQAVDAQRLLATLRNDQDPIAQRRALDALIRALTSPGIVPASPRAQPEASITVGASPFTYTAPFDGSVLVTGGTISNATITRNSAHSTGFTPPFMIPLSRLDQLSVTYTVAPTMTFFPR